MKIHIVLIPVGYEPAGENQSCPSCGKTIIINHEARIINHINPPCDWFLKHAEIAKGLGELVKKARTRTAN